MDDTQTHSHSHELTSPADPEKMVLCLIPITEPNEMTVVLHSFTHSFTATLPYRLPVHDVVVYVVNLVPERCLGLQVERVADVDAIDCHQHQSGEEPDHHHCDEEAYRGKDEAVAPVSREVIMVLVCLKRQGPG